jgi:hypothetical protein
MTPTEKPKKQILIIKKDANKVKPRKPSKRQKPKIVPTIGIKGGLDHGVNEYGFLHPSRYTPEFSSVEKLEAYLEYCRQNCIPKIIKIGGEDGIPAQSIVQPRYMLPSHEGYARWIGISIRTFKYWLQKIPEFKNFAEVLSSTQKVWVINHSGAGLGQAPVHKLILMSNHDMKEKREVDNNHIFGVLRGLYESSEDPATLNNVREADVIDVFKDDE